MCVRAHTVARVYVSVRVCFYVCVCFYISVQNIFVVEINPETKHFSESQTKITLPYHLQHISS